MERPAPAVDRAELASYERVARLGRTLLVVGAVCAVGAALCYATGVPLDRTLALAAAFTLGLGLWIRRETAAAELLNAALRRQSQGQFEEAAALLSRLDGNGGSRVRGAVAYQRGRIAFAQGRLEEARRQFDESISVLGGITLLAPTRVLSAAALAHRAVAEASLGEVDAATRDIAATERSPSALPEALAHAALARVMLLDRAEKYDEVESELARNDELLHEFTPTRTRELLRRIERKLATRGSSAYRTSAEDTEADEVAYAARIDRVEVPVVGTRVGAPTARSAGSRILIGVVGLWAFLIAMFLAIWFVLQPVAKPEGSAQESEQESEQESSEQAPPHAEAPSSPALLPYIVAPMTLGFMLVLRARGARRGRRFREGLRAMARGDHAAARSIFGSLASGRAPDAAVARNALSMIAYREGAFAEAIEQAEATVALGSRIMGAEAEFVPTAKGLAAVARAASGDREGALAALAALARDHAGFHALPSVRLRVLFLVAVRDGERARAKELLAERTLDVDLTHAEELLARIVACSSRGERERIERELARHPRVARWVTTVSPPSDP